MKTKWMKGAALAAAIFALGACQKAAFRVEGTITEAADSVLYLENMSLDGPVTVDSVTLSKEGNFSFEGDAPDAPEFYRLRIAGEIINLSIDSTETVRVKASYPTMLTDYSVEGSENCEKIKELALKQIDLQQRAIAVARAENLSRQQSSDSIMKLVEAYKADVKLNYIFKEPMKAYAYFALFQTLGNGLIFDPRGNKEDNQVYAAVATSWDTYYPHALRGQNLHNIAIEGMKNQRIMEAREQMIDPGIINTSNIIDVELEDSRGIKRKLSDLKGKVIILDFHYFGAPESTQRIMQLRDIYNKYNGRGLEIYQVSVDDDEHLWKQQTAALPWVCVRDPQGLESPLMLRFNLQNIPTFFLVDRNCELYKRDQQIKDLDAEIQSIL